VTILFLQPGHDPAGTTSSPKKDGGREILSSMTSMFMSVRESSKSPSRRSTSAEFRRVKSTGSGVGHVPIGSPRDMTKRGSAVSRVYPHHHHFRSGPPSLIGGDQAYYGRNDKESANRDFEMKHKGNLCRRFLSQSIFINEQLFVMALNVPT